MTKYSSSEIDWMITQKIEKNKISIYEYVQAGILLISKDIVQKKFIDYYDFRGFTLEDAINHLKTIDLSGKRYIYCNNLVHINPENKHFMKVLLDITTHPYQEYYLSMVVLGHQ
jgi:hypothetical protein